MQWVRMRPRHSMRIDILTLFPEMFTGPLTESIVKRAVAGGRVEIVLHQLRDYAPDKHGTVDDSPYGGGVGMVLKVDVIDRAISAITVQTGLGKPFIVLLTPQGQPFRQATAHDLSKKESIIFICGHYEGFDERVRSLVDYELSIGDYVLTGGELAAMVVADAVIRLLPGALGKDESSQNESYEHGLLDYPQYTRPADYKEMAVPSVLLHGDHAMIRQWRHEMSKKRTAERRPDLLDEPQGAAC